MQFSGVGARDVDLWQVYTFKFRLFMEGCRAVQCVNHLGRSKWEVNTLDSRRRVEQAAGMYLNDHGCQMPVKTPSIHPFERQHGASKVHRSLVTQISK